MDWSVIIVAIISGGTGVISSLIVARSTTNKLLNELKMQQVLADEKINSYQRVTNEKIDDLRRTNQSQQEWGTRIALCEAEIRSLKEGKK